MTRPSAFRCTRRAVRMTTALSTPAAHMTHEWQEIEELSRTARYGPLRDGSVPRRCVRVLHQGRTAVLQDHPGEGAAMVAEAAAADSRVRLVRGGQLPAGWCGKQHACWQLSRAARHDTWVFLDVDVSPRPDAIGRSIAWLDAGGVGLRAAHCGGTRLEGVVGSECHFAQLLWWLQGVNWEDSRTRPGLSPWLFP